MIENHIVDIFRRRYFLVDEFGNRCACVCLQCAVDRNVHCDHVEPISVTLKVLLGENWENVDAPWDALNHTVEAREESFTYILKK